MSNADDAITLRPATVEDRERVFRWRNDPSVIARGSWHRGVEWEEHEKWFAETILGDCRRLFIVLHGGNPIGQIRFDRQESDCVISVYLLPPFTGRGWGSEAIRIGSQMIFKTWKVDRLIACVRCDNPVGRAAFLKASFREAGNGPCLPEHYSLVLQRAEEIPSAVGA